MIWVPSQAQLFWDRHGRTMKGKEVQISLASQFFLRLVLEEWFMGQEVSDTHLPTGQLERRGWRGQTVQVLALPLANYITLDT